MQPAQQESKPESKHGNNSKKLETKSIHAPVQDKERCAQVAEAKPTQILVQTSKQPSKRFIPVEGGIPGLYLIYDFVSETEEASILEFLDQDIANPWRHSSFNGNCETKKFGVKTVLYGSERAVHEPGQQDFPLPGWIDFLILRLKELPDLFKEINPKLKNELIAFDVNEFNANSYQKHLGHFLRAHVDDRQLSGPFLANLSLAAEVTMRYVHEKNGDCVDVVLPPRTLQLVTQTSRYDWTHEIPNFLMEDTRRVSLTLRQSGAKFGIPIHAPV
jgi:alkylated DNA repair dioxygenase AlkB